MYGTFKTRSLLQYVFEFKKFVLNLQTYVNTYLCTCKYHPLETTYLPTMYAHQCTLYRIENSILNRDSMQIYLP